MTSVKADEEMYARFAAQRSERKQYELDNPECPFCKCRGFMDERGYCDACPKQPPTALSWMAHSR